LAFLLSDFMKQQDLLSDFLLERLENLARRYKGHPATSDEVWNSEKVRRLVDASSYRSHNMYVWQTSITPESIRVAYDYHTQNDPLGALQKLDEDGSFGARTFNTEGKMVSRDLLDSISELNFLERELGISSWPRLNILDIGAGYGRFAERCTGIFSNANVYCTDAVPLSTAICEYHLEQSGCDRAHVIPLDQTDRLKPGMIDLAVSMHCFNEIALSSVEWWIGLIKQLQVPYLFLVCNDEMWLSCREAQIEKSFETKLVEAGFTLEVARHKYAKSAHAQQKAVFPESYALFVAKT
jgi:2-polyprenyl-3-methyl-5-hydroxy-6-metoxy-1,4-benzoquinol methylase